MQSFRRVLGRSVLAACSALAVLLCMVGLGSAGVAVSAAASQPRLTPVTPPAGLPRKAVEEPGLRTADSRTYALPDGQMAAIVSPSPVNYRDDHGAWQPIDNPLVRTGGGFKNAANAFRLKLPADLSGPVSLSRGKEAVSFALQGAQGPAVVSGSHAVYRNALPGVTARYDSLGAGVKESLTLRSAAAATPRGGFVYELRTSRGLSLRRSQSGGIAILAPDGKTKLRIAPASMSDARGVRSAAVKYVVAKQAAGRWKVTLEPSERWLRSSQRRWPVTIDPTVIWLSASAGEGSLCEIQNGQPNTSFCGDNYAEVGQDANGNTWRTLSTWSLDGIPMGSHITFAEIDLFISSQGNSSSVDVSGYPLTRDSTQAATWNSYDGTNDWTTPGGDFSAANDPSTAWPTTAGHGDVDVTSIVSGWLDGPLTNHGILMKPTNEPASNWFELEKPPSLEVDYTPPTGLQRQFTYQQQQLSDRSDLEVNVASGDLVLHSTDVQLAGVGLPLDIQRFYNSLEATASPTLGETDAGYTIGVNWALTPSFDVELYPQSDGVELWGPNGEILWFKQNGDGSFQTPAGADATLATNADGSYTLTYDQSGEKLNFVSLNGGNPNFLFLKTETDRNGNQITLNYDDTPEVTSITDTHGQTTTFGYDPASGLLTKITDPAGRTYQYGYDSGDRSGADLTSYTDPAGKVTSYTYNRYRQLTQITDPLGHSTVLSYDDLGRVTSIERGLDSTGQTCLLGGGCPTTTYAYQQPGSSCPNSSLGQTVATDPNGHATTYCYDGQGRVTKTINPDGHAQSVSYSGDSKQNCVDDNPCSSTDAEGKTTSFGYNDGSNGVRTGENLLYAQSPLEGTTNRPSFAYGDTSNNPYAITQQTDPEYVAGGTGAHSWLYSYDSKGNTLSKSEGDTAPGQNPVTFTYNTDGTVATATDAKGNQTRYCYDATQNCSGATTHDLTGIIPPTPLGQIKLTYDSLHRVHTISDGNGQTRTYTYDPLDRVTQIAYTNGPTLTFTYDTDGNLTAASDPSGSYTYHYDAMNRLTQEDQPGLQSVHYSYDLASNLASLTDIDGQTTNYTYTPENQVATLTEPGAANPIRFSYDNNDNAKQISYPTSPTAVYECLYYDDSQRLNEVTGETSACPSTPPALNSTLPGFSYSYTAPGSQTDTDLRQSMTAQYPGGQATTSYDCYDPLGRLASTGAGTGCPTSGPPWGNPSAAYQYVYDKNGNLSSKTINGTTTNYTVNNDNQLTGSGFAYDANGNMSQDANVFDSASYNQLDQQTSITPSGGSAVAMTYNGLGQARRLSAGATSYVDDQLGLEKETGSPATYYTREPDGTVVGERRSGASYYYLFDGLGSVVAAVDSSGTLQDTFKYDPYGNTTNHSGSLYEPIQYAGGYNDAATTSHEALYKFGQRYYDPTTSRWTQQDTANNPLDTRGWNQYDYAGDNPVNNVDPSGMCWTGFCWAKHAGQAIARFGRGIKRDPADFAVGVGATFASAFVAVGGGVATAVCLRATEGIGSTECLKIGAFAWAGTGALGAMAGYEYRRVYRRG